MTTTIERAPTVNLEGQITRRNLLLTLLATAVWRPRVALGQGRLEAERAQSLLPIRVVTLNHVSFGCADLQRTVAWYEKVLGIPRHAFQDYGGGRPGPDGPSSRDRPARLHGPLTNEPTEPECARHSSPPLLLGYRGLQRPPDPGGAR